MFESRTLVITLRKSEWEILELFRESLKSKDLGEDLGDCISGIVYASVVHDFLRVKKREGGDKHGERRT